MDKKDLITELDHELAELKEKESSPPPGPPVEMHPSYQRIQLARHPKRPHSTDYIPRLFTDFSDIHGDRAYGDDAAILCGMANFLGRPMMVIAQEKGHDTKQKLLRNFGMPKPEGYRKALRAMRMAEKFGRPIVTLVDTMGAYPGVDAEERGQAEAIAVNLREMARLKVPIVTVVIGEGGSGGALGIGVANRVFILENAYYSVISPESCAAIIWRDAGQAEKAAAALRITAQDLQELGIVDDIVPEPEGGAHEDPSAAAENLGRVLRHALAQLSTMTPEQLVEDRYQKFRKMASFYTEQ